MGLDGALDSDDLQSFALQIANGMVRSAYENSYAMHDLHELVWSGVSWDFHSGSDPWLNVQRNYIAIISRAFLPFNIIGDKLLSQYWFFAMFILSRTPHTESLPLSLPECLIGFCEVIYLLSLRMETYDVSTFTWCYLFFRISQNKIWTFGWNLLLAKFGSERVKASQFSEFFTTKYLLESFLINQSINQLYLPLNLQGRTQVLISSSRAWCTLTWI